ncbi:hypothetical protein [Cohnella sp. REN36]|uniref:hypothetical protein n=1 Tax=Cohnella sp. REN36 TaxID=2887347 RepID=UPI001D13422E|nr:hypothetical protein [Cohnella sp. REN36]MCC3372086.1 hypothetical protein [Cohnella sp. REN36]
MSVQVVLGDRGVEVNISGWTAVTNLRKTIHIPYSSIEEVQSGNFKFPWTAVKRTGIASPRYKAGVFIIDGKKYFLSYRLLLQGDGKIVINEFHTQLREQAARNN